MKLLFVLALPLLALALQANGLNDDEEIVQYEGQRVARDAGNATAATSGTVATTDSPAKNKNRVHHGRKPENKDWTKHKPEEKRGRDDKIHDAKKLLDEIKNSGKKINHKTRVHQQFHGKSLKELKQFLGVDEEELKKHRHHNATRAKRQSGYPYPSNFNSITFPDSFDVTQKWPQCNSLTNQVQNQGRCGNCWAVSTAAAITDRRCIAFNSASLKRTSAWDLTTCCSSCWGSGKTEGCHGGSPYVSTQYYTNTGIVTGNDYPYTNTSSAYCKPYPLSPSAAIPTTNTCSASCKSGYTTSYSSDKKKGSSYFPVPFDDNAVMYELMTRGPVVVTFAVYEDFYDYAGGTYWYSYGDFLSYHAVKLIGWGVDEDGYDYWRVVNSWGTSWGDNGFFNILRGWNECEFEEYTANAAIAAN